MPWEEEDDHEDHDAREKCNFISVAVATESLYRYCLERQKTSFIKCVTFGRSGISQAHQICRGSVVSHWQRGNPQVEEDGAGCRRASRRWGRRRGQAAPHTRATSSSLLTGSRISNYGLTHHLQSVNQLIDIHFIIHFPHDTLSLTQISALRNLQQLNRDVKHNNYEAEAEKERVVRLFCFALETFWRVRNVSMRSASWRWSTRRTTRPPTYT